MNEYKWSLTVFLSSHLTANCDCSLQGRNPFFLEPSVIITITDGNRLTNSSGVPDEVRSTNIHCLWQDYLYSTTVDVVHLLPMCAWIKWASHISLSLCSCTSLWTLLWLAASSPKSLFVGTRGCLLWCWGCQEQLHQTPSSSAASPQMSQQSPRCVRSQEVWYFPLCFIRPVSPGRELILKFDALRSIVLRANTKDAEPVSGVTGPKGSEWRRHQLWEDGARSTSGRRRWVVSDAQKHAAGQQALHPGTFIGIYYIITCPTVSWAKVCPSSA